MVSVVEQGRRNPMNAKLLGLDDATPVAAAANVVVAAPA